MKNDSEEKYQSEYITKSTFSIFYDIFIPTAINSFILLFITQICSE